MCYFFFVKSCIVKHTLLPYKSILRLLASPPCDHKIKAGNMSSWWGPTWISVRCRGKSEWRSSPVGSAQTQRRAQMRPPTPATPKHPCQVKTTRSEPQIDRQAGSQLACQLLCTASHVPSEDTKAFLCLYDLIRSEMLSFVWSCSFGLQSLSLCP